MKRVILWAVLMAATTVSAAQVADSLLTEKEAPLLTEKMFADVIRKGNCIVMGFMVTPI